ncbi:uncharacterized protein FOMMEDRAFT_159189 [Fomitiporia mediterranea MF3/22]|uniref:uncharacterized protein n=1 Tax=Fomitiporia mediterranea (strain MF3/22) TaxID=694068 RepID=UPI0004408CFC|nr:uncharacterized protein FOMMEDRAFT_159189 [Fomitiporia mediterranea MF3/22]EJD00485.1 hypothetical protein FOMMEDRAFT_159189 [Fomitiporia mediterranea MF3/22]
MTGPATTPVESSPTGKCKALRRLLQLLSMLIMVYLVKNHDVKIYFSVNMLEGSDCYPLRLRYQTSSSPSLGISPGGGTWKHDAGHRKAARDRQAVVRRVRVQKWAATQGINTSQHLLTLRSSLNLKILPMLSIGAANVAVLALLGFRATGVNAAFQLVQSHSGANFLNNWTFATGTDFLDNVGDVVWQSEEQAQQEQLTFLNAAGNFVIKVDNTTDARGNSSYGRNSVKMNSTYTISSGNLVLFDAFHIPYGCSVWPSFWTRGASWPDDGEIDIVEAVNMVTENSISLHTLNGCKHPDASASGGIETGNLISTDCFNQTNFNQGCIVDVPGPSYGAAFAQSGGGIYALNWNSSGIFIWFFQRGSIPSDLPTDSPNPDGWGLPTAAYPVSNCDFNTFIKPQKLILEIDICGDFAGLPNVYSQTCSGLCTDLVQIPSNYDNAYFEIGSIKVFQQTNGSSTTATSPAGATTSQGGSKGSGASRLGSPICLFIFTSVFGLLVRYLS